MSPVESLVLEAFLAKGGRANTIKELKAFAEHTGKKISLQRLRDECGASPYLTPTDVQVPRREMNYGTICGYANATAWRPTLIVLASEINRLRSERNAA